MSTLTRSLAGLFISATTLGVLLLAGGQLFWAFQEAQDNTSQARVRKERLFSVNVAPFVSETITPVMTAYGTLYSWRSLELKASVAGPLVELAPELRDGSMIQAGQLLFRIDPSKLETALAMAESDLDEAQADRAEANAALALARLEVDAAAAQLDLRTQALERQQDLKERGLITQTVLETAVLAQSAAEQTLIGHQQVLAQTQARIARSEIALKRRQIALKEAGRNLSETTVTAPFDGVMNGVTAVLGRLVSTNEKLGELIDPAAMEVAFRVTNNQFSRLLNNEGALRRANVVLSLVHGNTRTEVNGRIERAGAEVGEGQIGRLVYARLLDADASTLRPGDFLTVQIPERPLDGVARIPASSATTEGHILILGDDGRLEEIEAQILRQQGDDIIVTGVPFGRSYVVERSPQIGAGIQVQPVEPLSPQEAVAAAQAATEPAEPDTIALDDERRARLIAFVQGRENMQAASKERVLKELEKPEVSREIVERFEAKMEQ